MMLLIAVEVADVVCGVDCSIFSQTVDRLPPKRRQKFLRVGGQRDRMQGAAGDCR